jgi:hypothetical protein
MHRLLVGARIMVAGRGPAAQIGIFVALCLGDCAHEVSILIAMIGAVGRCGLGLRRRPARAALDGLLSALMC